MCGNFGDAKMMMALLDRQTIIATSSKRAMKASGLKPVWR
jgi:hypothetical protein